MAPCPGEGDGYYPGRSFLVARSFRWGPFFRHLVQFVIYEVAPRVNRKIREKRSVLEH